MFQSDGGPKRFPYLEFVMKAGLFGTSELTAGGNVQRFLENLSADLFDSFRLLQDRTGVDIKIAVGARQMRIAANFHNGAQSTTDARPAAGGEERHLRSAEEEGGSADLIVTGGIEHIESLAIPQPLAVLD